MTTPAQDALSPGVRHAYWLGFLGCAVSATGLMWAAVGTDTGRWLVVAGIGLTLIATVGGLWGIGWRGLAVASAIFLGAGTAGLAIITGAHCAPATHHASTPPTCSPAPLGSQP